MSLNRIEQIFIEEQYQYLVLNKFRLLSKIENEKDWVIEFYNSDYFKIDSQIDYIKKLPRKQQSKYLPVVFNLDKLAIEDFIFFKSFKELKNEIIKEYKKYSIYNYEDGSEYDYHDFEEFKRQLEIIQTNIYINSRCYLISQDWYSNTDEKINEVFQFAGFINTYYYLFVALDFENNFISSVIMGYD